MGAVSTRRFAGAIGTSGGSPKGAPAPLKDISDKIRCILIGTGINRETFVYVRPGNLQQRIADFAKLEQTLICPKNALADEIERIGLVEKNAPTVAGTEDPSAALCFVVGPGAKPLICLQTGQFYVSADAAGRRHNLTGQAISYQVKKGGKTLKGLQFRLATTDEIRLAVTIPGWKAPLTEAS